MMLYVFVSEVTPETLTGRSEQRVESKAGGYRVFKPELRGTSEHFVKQNRGKHIYYFYACIVFFFAKTSIFFITKGKWGKRGPFYTSLCDQFRGP